MELKHESLVTLRKYECQNSSEKECEEIRQDLEANLASRLIHFESSDYWDGPASFRLLQGLIKAANDMVTRENFVDSVFLKINHTINNLSFMINCRDELISKKLQSPVRPEEVELIFSQNPLEYFSPL